MTVDLQVRSIDPYLNIVVFRYTFIAFCPEINFAIAIGNNMLIINSVEVTTVILSFEIPALMSFNETKSSFAGTNPIYK